MALYVKANEKELIRANINSIIRACNFIGLYPVCEYKKGGGKTTLTYTKPDFGSMNKPRPQNSCPGEHIVNYLTYNVMHKEGINSKCQKTYSDSFNMTCKLGSDDAVNPAELNADSPVQIYFNGFTLNSTLGAGDKTKNLEDAEKGGMSVYNVQDSVSQMNLNVAIRWNKKGSAFCTFKGTPFKDLAKTDPKFEVLKPTAEQMPSKTEQWYYSTDGNPIIAMKLGTIPPWSQYGLAYTGSNKDKTSKGVDTTTWTMKGKTAWW